MRIRCQQDHLTKGLAIVGRAVGTRTTLPVLTNVLLASDGSRLKLAGTNLEIGITTWIPATVEAEGSTTVPARLFGDFVNSLPVGQKVQLELDEPRQSVKIQCGRYEASMKGIEAQEFPPIPTAEEQPTVSLDGQLLREMVTQVAFAAARDDSRPVLTGVNLHIEHGRLVLAAADGFRLSVREAEVDGGQGIPDRLNIIVPARGLIELARVIGDSEEPVEITVTANRNQVLFRVRTEHGEVNLVSRLIDGQFPNYQQIIPKSHTTRVVLKRPEFVQATRLAALFARDAARIVRLDVAPPAEAEGSSNGLLPGRLAISATAAEVGENHGELDAVVDGEETHIAFDSEYLTDVLGVLNTDEVALEMSGPQSPGIVRGVGLPNYVHVIMPMYSVR
jgi:DNA polymerase-3 subunit beta